MPKRLISPIAHERPPLLQLLASLVGRRRLVLVFVGQRCLSNAIGIVGAFLGPGAECCAEPCTVTCP